MTADLILALSLWLAMLGGAGTIILALIIADDWLDGRERRRAAGRHALEAADPDRAVLDAHPVPDWALAHYRPRHLVLAGGEAA